MIIDVNTSFGKIPYRNVDFSIKVLTEKMRDNGISAAFTYSLKGLYHISEGGNKETLKNTSSFSFLFPVATLDIREYLDWEKMSSEIDKFKMVRFFPELQNWKISSQPFIELCTMLSKKKIPIMISANDFGVATEIAEITFLKNLNVILTDINYSWLSEAVFVMKKYPNVYVETSTFASPGIVEDITSEVGVRRILFGSGILQRPAQPVLNVIFNAEISEGERDMIFYKNATELFSLNLNSAEVSNSKPQSIYSGPVIDMHAHLGPWPFPIKDSGIAKILDLMKKNNIEKAILSSVEGFSYDISKGNRDLYNAIKDQPSLYEYIVLDPTDLELTRNEIRNYFGDPKILGSKVHCEYSNKATGSEEMRALFKLIAKYRKPVLIHNSGNWMPALREIALEYPELPIIIAHAAWRGGGIEKYFCDTQNVYMDFSNSHPESEIVNNICSKIDIKRILFGSDMDINNPAFVLGIYQDANLNENEMKAVMYDNAKRLFGI
jgi:predicted TIM-barrel fold metal-dependent hydrolase